jgi:calcineurin-like phosphoesterase family protein
MSKVYVCSDTHFGHKNIIGFEAAHRPYVSILEHDRDMVARWNAVVTKRDTVWHLGDVFFGKDGHLILAELSGYKKLVLGNHDHYPLAVYQQYFGKIHGAAEFDGCLLTHVPVHPNQMYRYRKNIHGHMHSKCVMKTHEAYDDERDERYVCVSMERIGLSPVLMHTATGSAQQRDSNS